VEADSLTVQKELVIHTPGLYSVLGPYSLKAELERGQIQVSRLVKPDLVRHVTLGFPRQGKLSPASRVVAETVQQLVESWGNQLFEPSVDFAVDERLSMPAVESRSRRSAGNGVPRS
jgi:hypothetical protein